ncbi:uncharacterized protein LOC133300115 [Gastrolobium bilobum]|uniref:uncharacterized protein LOC133300115 n=1 Tax=Gastrolobium bilobum TaxID=150636 RepID=UPI002AAF9610|nr:uncharacterized protein LOC133300115 [Gastrolobium bilobum]
MDAAQNKCILLMVFVLLCSFSIQSTARTLRERSNRTSGDANTDHHMEAHADLFKPKEEEFNTGGEVFSMDYTPASRKPPIHN